MQALVYTDTQTLIYREEKNPKLLTMIIPSVPIFETSMESHISMIHNKDLIFNPCFKIIDNFLNDEDFNELCLLQLKQIKENEIIVYHNQINKNQEVKSECIAEKTVRRFFKN